MNDTQQATPVVDAGRARSGIPLTRIYIDADGNLVITDLWEAVQVLVTE
jgi:hypothetical protein